MKTCSINGCNNLVEGNTHRCASHNQMARRTERERKKQSEKRERMMAAQKKRNQEKRKPINQVSAKREIINEEYFKLVEQFKHDNPYCAAKINSYCTKTTDDPHHSKGRGKFFLDVTTWIPVCRSCHIFITNNPQIAMDKGLSFSRLATIPIQET